MPEMICAGIVMTGTKETTHRQPSATELPLYLSDCWVLKALFHVVSLYIVLKLENNKTEDLTGRKKCS
jgi:hypothetical protein